MISIASTAKFVPTAIAAAAIGLGALMTVGAPLRACKRKVRLRIQRRHVHAD